jgi:hypothetical protein
VLQEKLVAWDNGAKLALQLGVTHTKNRFERLRTTALMTYMGWTASQMRRRRRRRRSVAKRIRKRGKGACT